MDIQHQYTLPELGKSREMRELRFKTNVERLAANHLIPTFGFPPADNLLVTENQKEVPLMALEGIQR